MAWSGEHRAFVIEEFVKNGESVVATQRSFRRHFSLNRHDPVPTGKTIHRWVFNFRQTSSALNRRRSGRPRTRTAQENVTAVADSIEQSPRRSIRKHAFALHMSATSVHRILHRSLHMHPYKIMVVQELSERDYETRTNLSRDILQSISPTSVTICSDEAHFHLSGMVNKQNFRYWSQNNPRELHQRPLHSPKVTVWCAMGSFGVGSPYFFEEEGATVTVTSDRYCEMLERFLRPKVAQLLADYEPDDVWFQQDGATSHTSRRSLGILQNMFPSHVISLRGDIGWPPRSPDLNPCDFFLWGYVKSKVYEHQPSTLEHLKAAITEEINAIPHNMLERVMVNFRERLQNCIDIDGRHLSDTIFKTT